MKRISPIDMEVFFVDTLITVNFSVIIAHFYSSTIGFPFVLKNLTVIR